jgi:hypothetical protein
MMMRFPVMAASLAMVVLSAPAVAAVPIAGLVNSGQVAGGGVVTSGVVQEANWLLNGQSQPWNSVINGSFPQGPWLADNATSRWMTPTRSAGESFDPAADGFYTYALAFDLTGFQPQTASFAGRFLVDNQVSAIRLNGNLISQGGLGSFASWTSFAASSGFLNGVNTLEFTVRNLRVEFQQSSVTAVPEPASWAMLIAGFGLVGAAARRRRVAGLA